MSMTSKYRRYAIPLFLPFLTMPLLLNNPAQADVVANLDFNTGFSGRDQSGVGIVGNSGDNWNGSASFFGFVGTETPSGNTGNTSPFGAFELLDTAGVASGVSYQMTFVNDGDFGFNGPFNAADTSTQATGREDLFGDYLFVGTADAGESLDFELSGLDTNTDYNIYLFGVGDAANQGASWTLNGTTLTTSYDGNTTVDEGADYVQFSFNTGASTTQTFSATEFMGNIAVNGFQLERVTAVPEPVGSTATIITILGLSLSRRRHKQRKISSQA